MLDIRELFIQFFCHKISFLGLQKDGSDSSLAADTASPVNNVCFHDSRVRGRNRLNSLKPMTKPALRKGTSRRHHNLKQFRCNSWFDYFYKMTPELSCWSV